MDVMKLQEVHDRLIASRPEGTACPTDCPFCNGEYASFVQEGSTVSDKTFTEDEVAAKVTEALAPLAAELDALKKSAETAEVDARIEAAKTEGTEKIAELETRIDTLTAEAEAAKSERDAITTWLKAEEDKTVQEAESAARLDARVAQVAEVITLPEERIEERKAQWAALDDAAFEALLADYKSVAGEKTEGTGLPAATAMHASREGAGGKGQSALQEIIRSRNFGVDVRSAR